MRILKNNEVFKQSPSKWQVFKTWTWSFKNLPKNGKKIVAKGQVFFSFLLKMAKKASFIFIFIKNG